MAKNKITIIFIAITVLISLAIAGYFLYGSKGSFSVSKKEIADIGGDYEEDLTKVSKNTGIPVGELEKGNLEDFLAPNEDGKYTLEEVSLHSGKNDCWMVIHGEVYDVTDYVKDHPGKDKILYGCGEDATELFETRPVGSGKPHSQKARDILSKYEIGTLSTSK